MLKILVQHFLLLLFINDADRLVPSWFSFSEHPIIAQLAFI